jgi:DNA primase
MGRIPEAVIQEILDKTDNLAVFQEKLRLSKKGGKWWGLCPFHNERTPSFSIDPERGLYYCFGCQKGGSLVDFLMETEKLSFVEAIGELAEKAKVPIPASHTLPEHEETERSQILSLYEKLAGTFSWFLLEHESGKTALDILRSRGLGDALIRNFRLGYAPADSGWLYRFLQKKGYSASFLARTGLFSARNPRYPLFCDRIIFPIADQRGRVIAFGGRLISGDGPKYLNSPDTVVFRKQENLFGFDKALPEIRKHNLVLVCEGYMDALSFHAAGIGFAAAPLGTAFTSRQAQMLRRRTERILLCFDSDDAGQKAAERACAIAVQAGMEADVVFVREGKDASEILEKKGPEALKKVLGYSINSGDFLIRRAAELFDLGTVDGKSKASAFFYPYLDALDSEVKRNGFLEAVGRRMGMSAGVLLADYLKARSRGGPEIGRDAPGVAARREGSPGMQGGPGARTADLMFMTAVVLHPGAFERVRSCIRADDLDDTRARDLYSALEEASAHDAKEITSILSMTNDDAARGFVLSAAATGELDGTLDSVVSDGLRTIRIRNCERRRLAIVSELGRLSREGGSLSVMNSAAGADTQETVPELVKKTMQLDAEIARLKGEVDE